MLRAPSVKVASCCWDFFNFFFQFEYWKYTYSANQLEGNEDLWVDTVKIVYIKGGGVNLLCI